MALFTPGPIIAAASGSVGGIVMSRNRAGPYLRNRSVPINPGSDRQQVVRFAMAAMATRWTEILTPEQRAAWDVYADNVHLPNSLGALRNVGGIGMYIRSNVPRRSGVAPLLAIIDDAPIIFDISSYTAPVVGAISEATQEVSWAFTDSDDWADTVGGGMFVFASPPQNPSINFYKGPYNAMATIPGAAVPPTSPQTLALPFPVEEAQKVFFRCNTSTADGRLGSTFRGSGLVVA